MSLVGPRPLPVDEVKRFNDLAHRRRLSVKPGLTCLWQISGRNQISDFKDWVRLDLEYIDNWSLWLDLKILLRTIPAVFVGHRREVKRLRVESLNRFPLRFDDSTVQRFNIQR